MKAVVRRLLWIAPIAVAVALVATAYAQPAASTAGSAESGSGSAVAAGSAETRLGLGGRSGLGLGGERLGLGGRSGLGLGGAGCQGEGAGRARLVRRRSESPGRRVRHVLDAEGREQRGRRIGHDVLRGPRAVGVLLLRDRRARRSTSRGSTAIVRATRRSRRPSHHDVLEITWTVIPTIIVVFLFYYGWRSYIRVVTPPTKAVEINVVAQQWSWNFTHSNGVTDGDLHVPVNTPVRLVMTSKDVLHSFYVPVMRVKQDIIPRRYTYAWFYATGRARTGSTAPSIAAKTTRRWAARRKRTTATVSAVARSSSSTKPGDYERYLERQASRVEQPATGRARREDVREEGLQRLPHRRWHGPRRSVVEDAGDLGQAVPVVRRLDHHDGRELHQANRSSIPTRKRVRASAARSARCLRSKASSKTKRSSALSLTSSR